jgi:hypothetical protein
MRRYERATVSAASSGLRVAPCPPIRVRTQPGHMAFTLISAGCACVEDFEMLGREFSNNDGFGLKRYTLVNVLYFYRPHVNF